MMALKSIDYDVVVVGAGNAAIVAALSVRECGARVLVLEKAPKAMRGGDTYYTGGTYRFARGGNDEIRELIPDLSEGEKKAIDVPEYSAEDFYSDVMRITEGLADPDLIGLVVSESNSIIKWLGRQGMKWELNMQDVLHIGERLRWRTPTIMRAKGGGIGLTDMLFDVLEKKDIELRYETKATRLLIDSKGKITGLVIRDTDGYKEIKCKAVILACGGFQANREMCTRYLGSGWELVKIRGTKYDTGDGIRMAWEIGAQSTGHWSGCHATPIDADAPDIGDRLTTDVTNRLSYILGIMVNVEGNRFVDEGEDVSVLTYAKTGAVIRLQPQRTAYQIFDSKVNNLLEARYAAARCVTAQSIPELADKLAIDSESLVRTVKAFNESTQEGIFNPSSKDGKHTLGIKPPKSNWAQKLDAPPFYAYAVTCGITFTFGGLKINQRTQVLDTEDRVIPGLYAAGEIVGGIFYVNYPAGTGLTTGAVFGRIAGAEAAHQ